MMKKQGGIGAVLLLVSQLACAYLLPTAPDLGYRSMLIINQNTNGTYDFYFKEYPQTTLYTSLPGDLSSIYGITCGHVIGAAFYYADRDRFPAQAVYFDQVRHEVSSRYNDRDNSICPAQYNLMATADNEQDTHAVIVQPIFKSQPKVWIVIVRNFNAPFPGIVEANSKFLPNGQLFLVITKKYDMRYSNVFMADKTETLPIDYGVFNKPVDKPTCYALPEDHKLRPCTKEEAQLRSPALKVFLGEQ